MSRPKTIDRETILDAAERLVALKGAAGLTIGALAKEAGITKGGVQYSFPTKAAIVDALFERWSAAYQKVFAAALGEEIRQPQLVWAHVKATGAADEAANAKIAGLGASLLQTPVELASTREWYAKRLEGLDLSTEAGRRARLAFFAAEGILALRFFGFMAVNPQEWDEVFADIQALLGES